MTSRERLTAAFLGEEVDRTPWAPELNVHFVNRLLGPPVEDPTARPPAPESPLPLKTVSLPLSPAEDPTDRYARACEAIGADCLVSASPYCIEYDGVEIRTETEAAGRCPPEADRSYTYYETPEGTLRTCDVVKPEAGTTYQIEHLIKGADDFAAYRCLWEHMRVTPDYEAVERAIATVGDRGLATLNALATPLLQWIMYDLRLPGVHYELADHPREVEEIFDVMHEKHKEIYRVIAKGPGWIARPCEDTSTSLHSPAMFRRYSQRHLNDYADILHEEGKLFVPHLCGLLRGVLDDLAQTRLDGIEALTPPPTGDTPIDLARRVLGPDITLIGGIDPTLYAALSRDEMAGYVREVIQAEGTGRHFILGHEEISREAHMDAVMVVGEVLGAVASG